MRPYEQQLIRKLLSMSFIDHTRLSDLPYRWSNTGRANKLQQNEYIWSWFFSYPFHLLICSHSCTILDENRVEDTIQETQGIYLAHVIDNLNQSSHNQYTGSSRYEPDITFWNVLLTTSFSRSPPRQNAISSEWVMIRDYHKKTGVSHLHYMSCLLYPNLHG